MFYCLSNLISCFTVSFHKPTLFLSWRIFFLLSFLLLFSKLKARFFFDFFCRSPSFFWFHSWLFGWSIALRSSSCCRRRSHEGQYQPFWKVLSIFALPYFTYFTQLSDTFHFRSFDNDNLRFSDYLFDMVFTLFFIVLFKVVTIC